MPGVADRVLIAEGELGFIEGQSRIDVSEGIWHFSDADWALFAMLQDPVYMSELLFEDRKNKAYHGCYHVMDYQYPLFRWEHNYEGYPCARSVGKAMPSDAPVLTPTGWASIGELVIGDLVIGGDGRPTRVVGVFDQGPREIVELEFSDGATVECDYDHLWSVTNDTWLSRGKPNQLRTTRQIIQTIDDPGHVMGGAKQRWRTPLVGPVRLAGRKLPLDPYLLGLILGDGNLTRPTMVRYATVDDELVESFGASLDPREELAHDGGCNYRVRWASRTGHGKAPPPLLATLRAMGLMGHAAHEKYIPDDYLWSSVHDRLALLQGLVDTDGHVVRHSGGVDYSTASPRLAQNIRDLVLSLGGRCSYRVRPTTHRDSHRLTFRLPDGVPVARLLRKCIESGRTRDTTTRSIVGSRPVGVKPATCIKVEAEDGLFVTKDFVVTHNTESMKARAVCHTFRRQGEDMLITAPELIHLMPLCDAIENRIRDTRLTFEFLDKRNQKTGFTHKPFQVDFMDGTKIVGRIPKLSGTGVKGMHVPDLLIEEGQDYPEKGWIEVHETVMKDHVDSTGKSDFVYHFYGVHSGARDGRFYKLSTSGEFKIRQVTAMMRPGWGPDEKRRAEAIYGGTEAPDYKRNILGEAGGSSSAFFVTSRLMACLDQDRESKYNTEEFKRQTFMAEEVDKMLGPAEHMTKEERNKAMYELLGSLLDLPDLTGQQQIYFGQDVGLVNDPSVITLWTVAPDKQRKSRLKLVRMIHLWRFREKQQRQVLAHIGWKYGQRLRGGGIDVTGMGLPMFQAMEDDELIPQHLLDVTRGYVFNAKLPIGVDKSLVSEDQQGNLRDAFGNMVEIEEDPFTRTKRYVVKMSMIEASTRYLREFVDSTYLQLPFDTEIAGDMQGETEQRVKAMAAVTGKKKYNAFHILDSMRAFAMVYKAADVEAQLAVEERTPVMAKAVDMSTPGGMIR